MARWIFQRRQYTTVTGDFKPGLIDLGRWKWPIFGSVALLLALLTVAPFVALVIGTFMMRAGFFETTPLWTLNHWKFVLTGAMFLRGIRTTMILALTGGIGSPLLFSVVGYMIGRTRWRGRCILYSPIG